MRVHLDFGPQQFQVNFSLGVVGGVCCRISGHGYANSTRNTFQGLVFSKGFHGHSECVYVKSGSNIVGGVDFDVFYDKCGTKVRGLLIDSSSSVLIELEWLEYVKMSAL